MTITVRDLARMMCIDYTEVKADGTCTTDRNSERLSAPIDAIREENREELEALECQR